MHEQLSHAKRVLVEDIALFVRRNVHAAHKDLAVLKGAVAVLQVDVSLTDGLYLGACKLNACLVFFLDKVVMPCFFVRSNLLCAFFINSHGKTSLTVVQFMIPRFGRFVKLLLCYSFRRKVTLCKFA